jgi:hypothetical protein
MDEQHEHDVAELQEPIVINENVEKLEAEILARYHVVPDHSIVNIEFNDGFRVLHISQPVWGKEEPETVVKRTKSNCKHCFGFGYSGVLQPINPERAGQHVLYLCRCLRPVKGTDKND